MVERGEKLRPMLPRSAALVLLPLLAAALVACPTPKSPTGPPPEYEEPPAPSWLDEGGADGGGAEAGPAELPTTSLPPG